MGKEYLLLWIEAPLQSWGSCSKFGPRDTNEYPTKSGVYGLLLAALGYSGPQINFLKTLNSYHQSVLSFKKTQSPSLKDFQMVGSGYNKDDKWESMNIPRKADGGFSVAATGYGGSKMTYRYYLQDAYFAVIQEIDETLTNLISKALVNPVFDLYFGRKNCVPTDFIFRGSYHNYKDAEEKAYEIAKDKNLVFSFSVSETEKTQEEMIISDVPIMFGEIKKYQDRRVFIKRSDGQFSFTD